jgi:hypothetical protein
MSLYRLNPSWVPCPYNSQNTVRYFMDPLCPDPLLASLTSFINMHKSLQPMTLCTRTLHFLEYSLSSHLSLPLRIAPSESGGFLTGQVSQSLLTCRFSFFLFLVLEIEPQELVLA